MPIIQYLNRLPRTTAHPAGGHISVTLNQARETYLSLRREFIVTKSITPAIADFDKVIEGQTPVGEGESGKEKCRKLVVMIQGLLSLMQVRTGLVH